MSSSRLLFVRNHESFINWSTCMVGMNITGKELFRIMEKRAVEVHEINVVIPHVTNFMEHNGPNGMMNKLKCPCAECGNLFNIIKTNFLQSESDPIPIEHLQSESDPIPIEHLQSESDPIPIEHLQSESDPIPIEHLRASEQASAISASEQASAISVLFGMCLDPAVNNSKRIKDCDLKVLCRVMQRCPLFEPPDCIEEFSQGLKIETELYFHFQKYEIALLIGWLKVHEKVTSYWWPSDPKAERYLGADFNQIAKIYWVIAYRNALVHSSSNELDGKLKKKYLSAFIDILTAGNDETRRVIEKIKDLKNPTNISMDDISATDGLIKSIQTQIEAIEKDKVDFQHNDLVAEALEKIEEIVKKNKQTVEDKNRIAHEEITLGEAVLHGIKDGAKALLMKGVVGCTLGGVGGGVGAWVAGKVKVKDQKSE